MEGRTNTHGWQTTNSREIYANPWIRVREDAVVRPDGGEGIYGVVSMQHPSVTHAVDVGPGSVSVASGVAIDETATPRPRRA